MRLSLELLEAIQDCVVTIQKLIDLLEEDQEDMPDCINGEVLQAYLRGTKGAQELSASLLERLRAILAGG